MFKRILFASMLVSISALFVQAQIHIGATTSVTANVLLDKGLKGDPRYDNQYTINVAPIGFNFGVDIGKKFGLQLETILSNQDQMMDIVDATKKSIGERKL